MEIGDLSCNLNELLNIRFNAKRKNESCIEQSLKNIIRFYNEGDILKSKYEIGKLIFLVHHLEILKTSKPKLFDIFVKILLNDKKNYDKYVGTRFEISIAATLTERLINFDKTQPPLADFIVNDYKIFIECGSKHLNEYDKDFSFIEQLCAVIEKKSKKEYAHNSTALFLDISSIYYYLPTPQRNNIRAYIIKNIPKLSSMSKFGSFLFHVYIQEGDQDVFQQSYVRIDNFEISDSLNQFLDKHFPFNSYEIKDYVISNKI